MSPYRDNPAPVDDPVVLEPRWPIKATISIALGFVAIQIAFYGMQLGLAITGIDALIVGVMLAWIGYVRSGRYEARKQLKIDREVEKLLRGSGMGG